MRECGKFYVNGHWVDPEAAQWIDVENPATGALCGRVIAGSAIDVDRAVQAARSAFPAWSATSREERLAVLERVLEQYALRMADLASAITEEMGAPAALAANAQAPIGHAHFAVAAEVLRHFVFHEDRGTTRLVREPIGVCGLITPWNWPMNQIACKVAPALATGCTVVLKPSELSPFSAHIFAEVLDVAGVPPGVFNLIHGTGPVAGAAIAEHVDVDMVSFTGSTRGGVEVARAAALSVKRVAQELGGKSPNILLDLPPPDFAAAVRAGVVMLMTNSGQSCSAPSRMLVPRARMAEACAAARAAVDGISIGDPRSDVQLGPVVSRAQFDRVQSLIQSGIDEGAAVVAGGIGMPPGLDRGYFVRPTVFADVRSEMRIAREEIFGPVLVIMPYDSEGEAVRIANDTEYGLAAYVQAPDIAAARAVAGRLRAGQVLLNGASFDLTAPFGGYKRSGNGRECGELAFHEFLEVKAIVGHSSVGLDANSVSGS